MLNAECPVHAEFLRYALADPDLVGVWGGTTGATRQSSAAVCEGLASSSRPAVHIGSGQNTECPGQSRAASVSGGGGIRTRVLRSFNRPSPSAASKKLSGAASLLAVEPPRIQLSVPSGSLTSLPGKPYLMASTFRSIGLRPGERRYLSSERELRLGVCFWFRLFNVVPETTARFSYIDDRSRNQSPPWCGLSS